MAVIVMGGSWSNTILIPRPLPTTGAQRRRLTLTLGR